jgi:crossover junction endodeoxyribonuclease RuvC
MNSEFDNAYLGFDPGKEGAMAIIGPHLIPSAHAFDRHVYVEKLADLKKQFNLFAVVEHVGAMPGQGVTSCFSFGESFGWLQGVLDAMRIPYELARPQKWKKVFSCTSDKNTSIAVAERLFPEVDLRRTPLCRKPHDGKAEALLIAEYARRIRNG